MTRPPQADDGDTLTPERAESERGVDESNDTCTCDESVDEEPVAREWHLGFFDMVARIAFYAAVCVVI